MAQENAVDVVHCDFSKAIVKMNNILAGTMDECEPDHGIVIWVHSYSNGHI